MISLLLNCRQDHGKKRVNRLWHILQAPSGLVDHNNMSLSPPLAPNNFSSPLLDSLCLSSSASFGQYLILIGGRISISEVGSTACRDIFAHSSHGEEWVHVGSAPVALSSATSIVLPTGDMLVIGGDIGESSSGRIFKASFRGE